MRLEEYLRVPYMVASSSECRDDGTWERIVECPELPSCRVGATTITEAMESLTRQRVTTILSLLAAGDRPPVPRPPLQSLDAEGELRRLGLLEELSDLLDLHEHELCGRALDAR